MTDDLNQQLSDHDYRLGYDNAHEDLADRGRIYALERLKGLSRDHEGPSFVDGYTKRLNLAYTEAVQHMSVQAVDVKPITIDWGEAYDVDEEEGFTYWQSFTYDTDGQELTLIARGPGSYITAVYVDGTLYNNFDDYRDHFTDDDGELLPGALTERDFEALMEVEAYQHGAEGPMMNYWYPIDETVSHYFGGGGFSPEDAAAKINHTSLCVVEVDGNYGLALTGGGMDLSWDICEAYVALDMLPPTHFADLPRFASHQDTDTHRLVLHAIERAITWQQDNLGYKLQRVQQLRTDMEEKGEL